MLKKNFCKTSLTALAMATAVAYAPVSNAALAYSADFEGFTTGDIGNFKIGNIVNGGAGWFPGTFGAPGDYNTGYSAIVDEGGAAQGSKQMSVFSDYNPWSPFTAGPGTTVQAFVSNDIGAITADMVGNTYAFSFDAKHGNIDTMLSDADAFVKVLKSSDGSYIELANNAFDSGANLTSAWSGGSILLNVDAGMVGELLQIGFSATATDWSASGVVYDNLNFAEVSAVPVPAAVWLFGSGLIGLVGVARRKANA